LNRKTVNENLGNKMASEYRVNAVEQCFYKIAYAQPAELREIEKLIPMLTPDSDEQAELLHQILERLAVLNAGTSWSNN
jgi:hypothetical protein